MTRYNLVPIKKCIPNFYFLYTLILIIFLQSCAGTPEHRPKAELDAVYLLQQGTTAFRNDEYLKAINSYSKALELYQSFDSSTGISKSYINLIETTIALGKYPTAHYYLDKLDELLLNDTPQNSFHHRAVLLQVKLLFNESDYSQAIILIKPILPHFNQKQQVENRSIHTRNILSSMAKLTVAIDHQDAGIWVERLRLELKKNELKNELKNDLYNAQLYRLEAERLLSAGNFIQSKILLEKSLSIYHRQVYRRGIAACLQQMANLEIQQNHWELADNYLQRSLKVYLWILNRNASITVLKQLVIANNQLGRKNVAKQYEEQIEKLK